MSVDQITMLLGLIAGLIGVPLIQWVKGAFGWQDKQALTASGVVSLALAVLVLLGQGVFGGLTWADITIKLVIDTLTLIFATATVIYKYLVAQRV